MKMTIPETSKTEVPFSDTFLPIKGSVIIVRWDIKGTPMKAGDSAFFLSNIPNMQGHIIVAHKGNVYGGYHPDNFRVAREQEI